MTPLDGEEKVQLQEMSEDVIEIQDTLNNLVKAIYEMKNPEAGKSTFGSRMADKVANLVGSWKFLIFQSTLILIWVLVNVLWIKGAWDKYPFVLLNLFMSLQAANTAPLIMMAQSRQEARDRAKAEGSYMTIERIERVMEGINASVKRMALKSSLRKNGGGNSNTDKKES